VEEEEEEGKEEEEEGGRRKLMSFIESLVSREGGRAWGKNS